MSTNDCNENALGAEQPRDAFSSSNNKPTTNWETDIAQTLQLGEKLLGFAGGVIDLARALPKLMMLWLIMMPIILLTWCSFSALAAWAVVAASGQVGLGMLAFFLLQVFLLLVCRWLFKKYRARMKFPYTRAQIDYFMRSTQHEFERNSETKE